jgi:D-alanyl-D-alanine carboxypeptidase/D-alanyl-D-alanine-endopeptidase (penicillin-binding protein 4)
MRNRHYLSLFAVVTAGSLVAWHAATPASAASAGPLSTASNTTAIAFTPAAGSVAARSVAARSVAAGSVAAVPRQGPADAAASVAGRPTPDVVELQRDLERLINSPGWSTDQWSVMVVSLDKGDTLFSHGPSTLVAPASNMKVFTTSAALYYLGPDFRYNTFLMSTGPIENGVLKGDLVLYGTGDPTFTNRFGWRARTAFEAFVDTLADLGVKSIQGAVVGDGSYFVGSGAGEGWKTDYMNMSYAAPAGALQYSEGIVNLQIRPGAVGGRPIVSSVPGGTDIEVENEAMTVARGRSTISVGLSGYNGKIVVRGQIAKNARVVGRSVPVADPAQYTASVLNELLKKRGIIAAQGVRAAHTAEESPVTGRSVFAPALDTADRVRVLAIHNSPPLVDILSVVNHKSHNLMAETALRTVGRVAVGEGSAEAGTRAVMHLLEESAPGTGDGLTIVDGSGLSPLNRVNARAFIHVLSFMAKSPMFSNFWQTLPEAGASNGLHRMYRTSAEGNLRAKTGTIDNVSSLSGYVRAEDGEQLVFSIISNGVPSTYRAKRIEDAIGARIASFNRSGGDDGGAGLDPMSGTTDNSAAAAAPAAKSSASGTSKNATSKSKSASKSASKTYKIRKGDTLGAIAIRNGTTVSKLLKINPGLNPKRLVPGRSIKLP